MRDEIIRMAKEVGFEQISPGAEDTWICFTEEIERFYNLAVQHERETIANFIQHEYERQFEEPWRDNLCKQIRARGQNVND